MVFTFIIQCSSGPRWYNSFLCAMNFYFKPIICYKGLKIQKNKEHQSFRYNRYIVEMFPFLWKFITYQCNTLKRRLSLIAEQNSSVTEKPLLVGIKISPAPRLHYLPQAVSRCKELTVLSKHILCYLLHCVGLDVHLLQKRIFLSNIINNKMACN